MSMASTVEHPLDSTNESTGAPLGKDPKNPQRDGRVTRLGTASIPRLIVEFAVPSILGMLVNGAYNVVDSIFLGQAVGAVGIETMTIANPIMIIGMALSMLVGVGGNALAALRLGEGKRVGAEVSLGNTVFLCLVVSALVALCGAIPSVLDGLLTLSSATETVRSSAASFIRIICFGFVFQCIGMGVNNFIRTAGAPNRALGTMLVGAVACTAFNALFVLWFKWGVEGSALATICGQAVSCMTVLWYFTMTKNVPLRIHLRYMKPHAKTVGAILSLGLPSFFVQSGAAVASFVINYLLVVYGGIHPLGEDFALASIGVVQRVAMFAVLPLIGVSIAIQPLLGFNYGARLIGRVRKTFWYGVVGVTALGTFMWIIVHLFPEAIVGVFGIGNDSQELRDFTVFALKIQLSMLPIIGFQIVGANYFQATGQPFKSIVLTLTRQILFLIPLLFILPEVLPHLIVQLTGLDALYFAAPCSDVLAIITTGIFVLREMKRLKRLERGELALDILAEDDPSNK